ncbi:MAG TPA: CoA transferase, partial [Rugosimonospora sp.]|nr:CoA transferase [Rugosimonospora sp.]
MTARQPAPVRDATRDPLDGYTVAAAPGPAARCAAHLATLGATPATSTIDGGPALTLRAGGHRLDGYIDWHPAPAGAETVVQALTGLMAAHGRDPGVPRRCGVDLASFTAGLATTQGVLAALLAQRRGLPVAAVEVSVPGSALLLLNHHIAIATSGGQFPYQAGGAGAPPFRTADGYWVEFEVLSGDDWARFWPRLGVADPRTVAAAWLPFVYRYLAGRCPLPDALPEAVRRHTLAQVRATADACGIALSPVRDEPDPILPLWTLSPHPGADTRPGHPGRPDSAPLDGVRVVEVTSRLQGPLAGALLRMLGAEVMKIEPPGGDFGRGSPPLAGQTGAAYLAYNHGKRVVELDYKRPAGRAELDELVATADVFLHNWRPGRAESLGLDSADLATRNPGLVYAYASGWGPAADPPSAIAGDFLVQAYAGCGTALNPPGEPPFPSPLTLVDTTGGMLAATGILAALYLRERTGRGSRVGTSLLAGAQALRGASSGRWQPLDRPIRTVDGYLTVDAVDAATRQRLYRICGASGEPAAVARLAARPAAH